VVITFEVNKSSFKATIKHSRTKNPNKIVKICEVHNPLLTESSVLIIIGQTTIRVTKTEITMLKMEESKIPRILRVQLRFIQVTITTKEEGCLSIEQLS
jgi:hypothetical protein